MVSSRQNVKVSQHNVLVDRMILEEGRARSLSVEDESGGTAASRKSYGRGRRAGAAAAGVVDPSRGQQRGRDAGLACACTLTRKLAWLHVVHPIKGHQSAQALREGLPCHPSAPAVASMYVCMCSCWEYTIQSLMHLVTTMMTTLAKTFVGMMHKSATLYMLLAGVAPTAGADGESGVSMHKPSTAVASTHQPTLLYA